MCSSLSDRHHNIILSILSTYLCILFFAKFRLDENDHRKLTIRSKLIQFDYLGTLLLIGGFGCLFLALQWGGHSFPWKSTMVIGLLVGSGLIFLAFGPVQWKRGENATIPLRILSQRSILMETLYLFFN